MSKCSSFHKTKFQLSKKLQNKNSNKIVRQNATVVTLGKVLGWWWSYGLGLCFEIEHEIFQLEFGPGLEPDKNPLMFKMFFFSFRCFLCASDSYHVFIFHTR